MTLRRLSLIGGLLVALVVAVGGYVVYRVVRPPATTAFYTPPASLAGDQPGQLLASEAINSSVPDVLLWRITYVSTDLQQNLVPVSGILAVPTPSDADTAATGRTPLVAMAHGTVGINRGCAPSLAPFARADADHTTYGLLMQPYVDAGNAVVMADFEGLGVAGKNSYLVGEIEGRNVLDSVRAARQVQGVSFRKGVTVVGQSQGGHAALWAGQIAPDYAPDVRVRGIVAQAPATDLEAMFTGVLDAGRRGGVVSLLVMAADAYTENYPQVTIGSVLTTRGRGALSNVVGRLCLLPAILGTQLARPQDLVQPHGLDALAPYVRRNIPGDHFRVPVFLAQGDADGVVLPAITRAYAGRLCASGTALTYRTYPRVGHFDIIGASNADALAWMSRLGTDRQSQHGCGRT